MTRFPKYPLRTVHQLDGLWDFAFLGPDVDLGTLDVESITYLDKMVVPAAFDTIPPYTGLRGTVAYRRSLKVTDTLTDVQLYFEGVSLWCRVYVDGHMLAEHPWGLSPFWVQVPDSDLEEREIVVIVDNRLDFGRSPLHGEEYDFYQHGGIIRSVWWHDMPQTYIESAIVQTDDYRTGAVTVRLRLGGYIPDMPRSANEVPERINIFAKVDDGKQERYSFDAPYPDEFVFHLTLDDPHPWSPADPFLHTLEISAVLHMRNSDIMITRFGLRQVETRQGVIILNDEPVKLLGFNRHELTPLYGPASPDALLLADLQRMRDMGCNFVRGAHYPQDQRFLDMCDELGILVWEEGLGWGANTRHLTNEVYLQQHEAMLREMIAASANHPSVIIWGFLSESDRRSPTANEVDRATVRLLRQLDPTRLISYSGKSPLDDMSIDLVDVISFSLFPGWYSQPGDGDLTGAVRGQIDACLRRIVSQGLDAPFMISAIGAGAIPGWHDEYEGLWSEEYQATLIRTVVEEALNNDRVAGLALWQFADVRTYQGANALRRPRGHNNQGVFDEFRRPKLASQVVKELFNAYWASGD
ncbi:MAG: beta-galactosidase [Chloroflexi bacterium]|nr:beta-galactosidase [Chloroflexota bacterium]